MTDLLLLLALTGVVFTVWVLFTWWLAVAILHPIIDILTLFVLALCGG